MLYILNFFHITLCWLYLNCLSLTSSFPLFKTTFDLLGLFGFMVLRFSCCTFRVLFYVLYKCVACMLHFSCCVFCVVFFLLYEIYLFNFFFRFLRNFCFYYLDIFASLSIFNSFIFRFFETIFYLSKKIGLLVVKIFCFYYPYICASLSIFSASVKRVSIYFDTLKTNTIISIMPFTVVKIQRMVDLIHG